MLSEEEYVMEEEEAGRTKVFVVRTVTTGFTAPLSVPISAFT